MQETLQALLSLQAIDRDIYRVESDRVRVIVIDVTAHRVMDGVWAGRIWY